tara:strand:+ start:193 stop:1062 length:870 start_codon:yes stop_codon:yes gene_type:complete
VHAAAVDKFGARLVEELGQQVSFEQMSDALAQGHKSGDLPGMVANGSLDFCYIATLRFADKVPQCQLFDLPFIAEDRSNLFSRLDGALGDYFRAEIERETPHKVLGFWDNGLRHITNRVRALETPADCEGLVIRTQISETIGDVFRSLGFTAEPMDIKLYRERLDDPDIHAQDNDLPTILNFGIHKHHPHVTLTGHILGVLVVICSKAAYAAWSQEVRQAVDTAMADATEFQRAVAASRDAEASAQLAADGALVAALSDEGRARFRHAVTPVLERHRSLFSDPVFKGLV